MLTALGITVAAIFLRGAARHVTIASLVTIFALLFALGVPLIRMQYFCPAICRGKSGQMCIALTFDDGPDPIATPVLLDLLRREKVPATFFLIGRNVDAHPEIAKQIADDGHLIGNHTYNHRWSSTFTWAGPIAREMSTTQEAIQRATGVTPTYFRPPVGLTTPHFQTALQRVGLKLIGWDVRPMDSAHPANVVVNRVLANVRDGSIILLHDGGAPAEKIVEIVGTIVRELRGRGYTFARLDDLITGVTSSGTP